MQANVYNQSGEHQEIISLPEEVFNQVWNGDLVHQAAVTYQANQRPSVAHTKGRSEVRGGGRKPWPQKGTGNARHGSIRSPLWKGGGTTFGPLKERSYKKKLNKKMRIKALYSILSQKYRDGEVIFLDSIATSGPSTKKAKNVLTSLSTVLDETTSLLENRRAAYILSPELDWETRKSFRNIGNVKLEETKQGNPLDLLRYRYVIIAAPSESLHLLKERGEKRIPKKV